MPFARADLVTNNIFVETSSFQTQTQRLAIPKNTVTVTV